MYWLLCIINRQNAVIKYYTRVWREYLQQKYQTISKIINNIKKLFLCVCMYKMVNITKGRYESNGIEVIAVKFAESWLNERHIQQQLELKNLPALTKNTVKNTKNADMN